MINIRHFNIDLCIYFRERILGENNPDLLQSIIYRGAIYADLHNYYPCVKLWIRALKISELNKISVSTDIKRFTQVTMNNKTIPISNK